MMKRCENDPPEFDPAPARQSNAELGVSWNGKGIKARGLGALVLLVTAGIIGSNLYAGYRVEQAIVRAFDQGTGQHATIKVSQDRTSCIVAMDATQREKFRETYVPGAFKKFCPWVDE